MTRISVVVDHYCIHKAKAVAQWLAHHPHLSYCGYRRTVREPIRLSGSSAMSMTNAYANTNGNASAIWYRTSSGTQANGPWQYKLPHDAPEVTAAVEHIAAEKQPRMAA